jgi:GT2 family glycosyltransferase
VLILNEDTVLHEGSLDRMRRFMDQHPEVGACGPKILNPDGTQQPSAFRFPTPARVGLTALTLQRKGWIQSQANHIVRVDWVCGAAILARLPALRAVGGFDERLFIYSEDPDLCLRLREAGYATAYFPYASLVHFENATTSGVPERRIAQMERSRTLYARKHHGRAGEYAVRAMTAATFATRAALAKGLLTVPGGDRVKRVDEDAPRRFVAHVRAALRPGSMPGIEEAATEFNAERAAAS